MFKMLLKFYTFSFCLFVTVFTDDSHGTNSLTYTMDDFDAEISKTNHFVMFFAPWCGHCKRLAPTWDELGKMYNEDPDSEVKIAKVDCTTDTALCAKHDITGYPTLRFFKLGEETAVKYRGSRDTDSLKGFVEEQLAKKEADSESEETQASDGEPEKHLVELDEINFEKHIEMGNHFVKFYAPWCGHCQRLAPTWEYLAEAYSNDKSVTIAKLDCTANKMICGSQQVKGYPSLFFFKNGAKVDEFRGGRSLEELKEYVDRMLKQGDDQADRTDEKIPDKDPRKDIPEHTAPGVFELDDTNFNDAIAERTAFVKFYAPWCGHCKRLAPTWDDLAAKYHDTDMGDIDPAIAKVDCTKEKLLCGRHKVRGYPTLILFKNGQQVTEYTGPRDLESLQSFVDTHKKDVETRDEL